MEVFRVPTLFFDKKYSLNLSWHLPIFSNSFIPHTQTLSLSAPIPPPPPSYPNFKLLLPPDPPSLAVSRHYCRAAYRGAQRESLAAKKPLRRSSAGRAGQSPPGLRFTTDGFAETSRWSQATRTLDTESRHLYWLSSHCHD